MNLIPKFLNSGVARRIKVDRSGKNVAPVRPAILLPEVTVTPELYPETYFTRGITDIGNGRNVVVETLAQGYNDFDPSSNYGRTIYNSPGKSDTVYWGPPRRPLDVTYISSDSGYDLVSGSPSTEKVFNQKLLSGKYRPVSNNPELVNNYHRIYNAAKLKGK